MKAILVIDMPKRCDDEQCPICYDSAMCSYLGRWMGNETERPADCPLRPLPSKLVPFGYLDAGNEDGLYEKGYNDCIDEITGETE